MIRRLRTTFAVVILFTLVVAGGMAQRASAAGGAPPSLFSASFLPQGVVRGGTDIETLTLSNTSARNSSSRLGSADVTIPSGFKVTAFSVFSTPIRDRTEGRLGPKDWSASVSGGVLHLRAGTWTGNHIDTLQPGQSVLVLLWVQSPCNAPDPTTWSTVAGTQSGGHDFSSSSAAPSLRSVGTCGFDFTVGNQQRVGVPIRSTVVAVDGIGRPMSSFSGPAAVSGNLDPSPSGTAPSYNGSLNFFHGVALFQSLATAYDVESSRQLTVTSGALSGHSNHFNVVGGSSGSQLEFVQGPSDVDVSTAIAPAITVDATDQYGNPEPLNAPVTLAIGNDASSGDDANLGGTLTEKPASNVASFGDITLDQPGSGYTLTASAVGFSPATSAPFDVNGSQTTCDSGTCTTTNDSDDTVVSAPQGALTDVSFEPEGESFDCNSDESESSFGSIVNYTVADGYNADNPLTITFEWSRSLFANLDGTPSFCFSKDGEEYTTPPDCTVQDGEFTYDNPPPCIVSAGFTCQPGIQVECAPGPYVVQLEVTSDDPHAGAGP